MTILFRILGQRMLGARQGRWSRVVSHLTAAAIVFSPFVLIEIVLRLCVSPPPLSVVDPYVSFSGVRPLFVLDSTKTRFETDEERLAFFRTQSFAATKGPNTFRVFCLGGSTVQGRPYSVETSFTSWLELNLRAAQPDVDYEVVNCGGVSYASYRLVPIMRELLEYQPDLFILYTGHNEFLEDRTYRRLKETPRTLIRLHQAMLWLRSYDVAHRFLSGHQTRSTDEELSTNTVLPAEVQAKLDFRDGFESYHRDDIWHKGTNEHFRRNLETLVQMSQRAGIPIILMNPVANLKDSPPFKSEFRAGLSEREEDRVIELWEQADKLDWADPYSKARLLEQATAIDERHAGLLYMIGTCYELMGRYTEAREWYLRAKEEDVCPLRILDSMHDAILDVAARHRVQLVDVKALIEGRTEGGIPGDEWLLDHVHPSIEGHQLIADLLYNAMEEMELVHTPDGWQATRDGLWQRHLSGLNEAYYAHGADRLERVRQWSRGRIPNPPSRPTESAEDGTQTLYNDDRRIHRVSLSSSR